MTTEDIEYLVGEVRRLDAAAKTAKKAGYELALERVRTFGADLKGDKALSDEERYILDNAAEILELRGCDDDR